MSSPFTADDRVKSTIWGKVFGSRADDDVLVWRGIPYGATPIGALRWRAPRAPAAWGELDATIPAPCAPQIQVFPGPASRGVPVGTLIGDEDCLHLTIWSPRSAPPPQGRPVLVWFHGGGNLSGDGEAIDARHLALEGDLVVVSVTHRLGILGWFSHDALAGSDASAEDRSGNFATLDHIAALSWIRDCIADFGGDPARVTIAGQSSGGWNVRALLCSPLAVGLFHRAIVQSVGSFQLMSGPHGMALADDTPAGHPLSANELLRSLWLMDGLSGDADQVGEAVRNTPAELIEQDLRSRTLKALFSALRLTQKRNARLVSEEAETLRNSRKPPSMFADGHVLRDEICSHVPIIVGATRSEDRAFLSSNPTFVSTLFGSTISRDPARYARLADALAELNWSTAVHDTADAFNRAGMAVHAYRFDWDQLVDSPGADVRALVGACHGVELPFLFGTTELTPDVVAMAHLFDLDQPGARALSRAVMQYWSDFAHSAPLGTGDLPSWPAWNGGDYLVLDEPEAGGIRVRRDSQPSDAAFDALLRGFDGRDAATGATLAQDVAAHGNARLTSRQRGELAAFADRK